MLFFMELDPLFKKAPAMSSSTNPETKSRRPLLIGIAVLMAILAALALIYVKNPLRGNVQIGAGTASTVMKGFLQYSKPQPLPEIAFVDRDGKPLSLSQWRGRVVLLNIWATWCPPCRAEMPTLNNLQQQMGSDDFEVVALSIDKGGPDVPADYMKKFNFSALKIYNDSKIKVRRALKLRGYPTTLLIDRQGREIGRLAGPAEWDSPGAKTLINQALGAGS